MTEPAAEASTPAPVSPPRPVASAWSDFLGDFMDLSIDAISPEIYRRWCGISLVAGALERRVWVITRGRVSYPNLYVLLVGAPGTGKFIIEEVREIWQRVCEPGTKTPAFHVGPDNMTKASLLDTLAKAKKTMIVPSGQPYTYHSLLIAAEEFGVLLPEYDQSYIHTINSLYNNKADYKENRRTGSVRELVLDNPQINILAGVQPTYLASTFPEEAWSTGLARRIIMVYASEPPIASLFGEVREDLTLKARVIAKLGLISRCYGEAKWAPDASAQLDSWHLGGQPPVPVHSKLTHYNRSRSMMVVKLCVISAVMRTCRLVIEAIDVTRALTWLIEAETLMPDVFREMIGKSDTQVIEELHYFLMTVWNKNKAKPIHAQLIYRFLSMRVPSDKIERIVMVAERANIIERVGGTTDQYIPRPKSVNGVE